MEVLRQFQKIWVSGISYGSLFSTTITPFNSRSPYCLIFGSGSSPQLTFSNKANIHLIVRWHGVIVTSTDSDFDAIPVVFPAPAPDAPGGRRWACVTVARLTENGQRHAGACPKVVGRLLAAYGQAPNPHQTPLHVAHNVSPLG